MADQTTVGVREGPANSLTPPITITCLAPSNQESQVTLPPSAPSEYLKQMTAITFSREGFEGAEAGALCEVERLLENHILRLFESAKEYAELANRIAPNAADLLASQDEAMESASLRQESRESKRRRITLDLPKVVEPPSPPPPRTLDLLVDFTRNPRSSLLSSTALDGSASGVANTPVPNTPLPTFREGEDRKPTLVEMQSATTSGSGLGDGNGSGNRETVERKERTGPIPAYAHDGAPGLPGAWTRPRWDRVPKQDDTPPPESLLVTASSLEFVRKSASSGDIPPELGIVNYRLVKGKDRKRGAGSDSFAPSGGSAEVSAASRSISSRSVR